MNDKTPNWQPPKRPPVQLPSGPPGESSMTDPPNERRSPFGPLAVDNASVPLVGPTPVGDSAFSLLWSLLGFGVFLVIAVVGLVLYLPFADVNFFDLANGAELPVGAIGMSLLFQQLGQGGWPLVVAKWFPGVRWSDLRLGFKLVDLGIGLGTAFIALFTASIFGFGASRLVGLEDQSAAENTKFLTDAKDSPWLYLLIFCVVVGAPVAEELFFRGLVLSTFEKLGTAVGSGLSLSPDLVRKAGPVVGVIGSTVMFTSLHFIGGTLQETVVLFCSIGAVGVVLAMAAIYTNRLGASIVAHMIFNSFGAAAALGAFEGILPS